MKNIYAILLIVLVVIGCSTTKNRQVSTDKSGTVNDTVRIANDELEYEIIIIDPGFNGWLASRAKPRDFYSQQYMEARNRAWVVQWNINVVNYTRDRDLFQMRIDYEPGTDYGYEVNYMLFNYLTYFQLTNNIQLGSYPARI